MRTIEWDQDQKLLRIIDQRKLPVSLEFITCKSWQDIASAISTMAVRGAPAIGVAAAFGMAMVYPSILINDQKRYKMELKKAADGLIASRPTAVNITWAVAQMVDLAKNLNQSPENIQAALLLKAQQMADSDVEINKWIGLNGANLIENGDTIIHHCNTGSLATVDWGTALGAIRTAHEQGKQVHVLVDETRPRLQGARLTAWELEQLKIPYEIITDNAAGYFLRRGDVQKVMFGADRVAANGDVINKIGSYMLALAAHQNKVPVYSLFPVSTVDINIETGDSVTIEERDSTEVLNLQFDHADIVPKGARARNPAFDITPHEYLSALVTEYGIIEPPYKNKLAGLINQVSR